MISRFSDKFYEGEHINFELNVYPDDWTLEEYRGKPFWFVIGKKRNEELGYIEVYPKWKRYCFFPSSDTIFSSICLDDISEFIKLLGDVV